MMPNCLWDKNVKCYSETPGDQIFFSFGELCNTHPRMCVRIYFHDVEMLTFCV